MLEIISQRGQFTCYVCTPISVFVDYVYVGIAQERKDAVSAMAT